jgi:hypothetical protein
MRRSRLVALAALLVVTPALAQSVQVQPIQVQPIQRPVVISPEVDTSVQQDTNAAQKTMTIEDARKRIQQLARDKRELAAKLKEANATIEQMTSRRGSLVRAYCESRTLSRNTAGASEDCAPTGYICNEVSGLCKTSCTISPDCSTGFTCDPPSGRCMRTG